jgi:5'-3' exoribonuclease 1
VKALEKTADEFNSQRHLTKIKRVVIKAVPRQALLKPTHALYRLQGQVFAIGDRVIMVSDAAVGGVPFSLKGVVIGLNATSIDVVWDSPFIGGETLSGRCSEHRGSIVPFASCLNLTRKQFAVNKSSAPKAMGRDPAFQPKFGPQPVVPGQHFRANQQFQPQVHAASQGFRSRPPAHQGPMQYGNAAQGIRPRPAPAAAQGTTPQVQILHQALTGKTGGPIRPVRGRGGFAARPMNGHAVAPPHVAVPVPHNGATPVVRPTRGHPRGRGGFAGRGRGASNGTPSAQTAA